MYMLYGICIRKYILNLQHACNKRVNYTIMKLLHEILVTFTRQLLLKHPHKFHVTIL